jgi:hypothetical protein
MNLGTSCQSWGTPAQFTCGNAGPCILRDPGRTNVDFSVFKQFTAGEKVHLQLRAESFNLVNHPQFDLASQTIGSPSAGVITATVGTARHSVQLTPPVLIDLPRLAGVPKYDGLANA